MIQAFIAFEVKTEILRRRQHAGMLSRAIIVDRRWTPPGALELPRRAVAHRQMRAASQASFLNARLGQQASHGGEMFRLPAMRAAGNGEFAIVETIRIRRTTLDQRNGLHQFHRRARKHWNLDIAEGERNIAVRIRDRDGAAMDAFDQRPPFHLDEDRICRSRAQWSCSAISIGTPVACFEARMTSDVFTLATFGAAVSSWMMKS